MPQTPTAPGATPDPAGATPDGQTQTAQPATGGTTPDGATSTTTTAPVTPDPTADLGDAGLRALEAERLARREAERAARKATEDYKRLQDSIKAQSETQDEATARKERRLAELEAAEAGWVQERQRMHVEQMVGRLQSKLNIIDVDAVSRLMDHSLVEYDADGKPTNVEDLVKVLLHDKPYLASQRPPSPGALNAGSGTTGATPPRLTTEELEAAKLTGMSPERYAALKNVKNLDDWQKTRRTSDGTTH